MAKMKSSNEGSDGKLIDTWHYEYQGLVQEEDGERDEERHHVVKPKKVAIELRLIKHFTGDTPPMAVKSVEFLLLCKDPHIHLRGTGIEQLRAAMWDRLDKRFKTKWESYYLVTVSATAFYEGIGTGLEFCFRGVDRGVAWDGTLLLREYRSYRGEVIEPWPGEFRDREGRAIACIPATDVNRAALEEFSKKIDEMRERLAEFLRPEHIVKTLANLNGMQLLGTSAEEANGVSDES